MFRDQVYGTGGYGSLSLTEASPPQSFVEPLSLDEVKKFLKLPVRSPVDALEDAELSSLISAARGQGADTLEQNFQQPPAVAKPWVYWYWIDGNISKPGITADLEAMADEVVAEIERHRFPDAV